VAKTNASPTRWLLELVSVSSKKAQFKLSVWIMEDSRIIQAKMKSRHKVHTYLQAAPSTLPADPE
jgi:hypothetical protein